MSALTDSLGKASVNTCDVLVRFVGRSGDGEPMDRRITLHCLLVDARYSPKVQYWAPCVLRDRPECEQYAMEPYPFVVRIGQRASGIYTTTRPAVVDLRSSDELCQTLLAKRRWWDMAVAKQSACCDVPDLLHMRVTGHDSALGYSR